jgi:hypothetical protein
LRTALVSALSACASERQRRDARRFLQGLSFDELEYIAGFVGGCILDSSLADRSATLDELRGSPGPRLDDREHKIILAREYLHRCGVRQRAPVARAARAS